jgi:hypothetical protein
MGVLFEKFGFRMVYDAHSTLEAKLSRMVIGVGVLLG